VPIWLGVVFAVSVLVVGAIRAWLTWRSQSWVIGERKGTAVIVRRRGRFLELVLATKDEQVVQSRQERGNPLGSGKGYVDGLHLGMLVEPRPKRVLFLGGGAFMAPRQFELAYPDVEIDVVEENPLVLDAANRHFGFRMTRRLSVHVKDAGAFVRERTFGPYDLIVHDVYDAKGMPNAFTTTEFFADVRRALTDQGVLVVNVARSSANDESSILHTAAAALPSHEAAIFDVPGEDGSIENVVILLAPRIPAGEELVSRASAIQVAPFLRTIAEHRRHR
jgi:spermidine synthase